MEGQGLRRGRKPSIGVAEAHLSEIRKTLKALVTETSRLQQRLKMLDAFYTNGRSQSASLPAGTPRKTRRGPNVRDLLTTFSRSAGQVSLFENLRTR
jgi:hypothetical protein